MRHSAATSPLSEHGTILRRQVGLGVHGTAVEALEAATALENRLGSC